MFWLSLAHDVFHVENCVYIYAAPSCRTCALDGDGILAFSKHSLRSPCRCANQFELFHSDAESVAVFIRTATGNVSCVLATALQSGCFLPALCFLFILMTELGQIENKKEKE